MYTDDMTMAEARDWEAHLADLAELPRIPEREGYLGEAGREQLAWDLEDVRERIAALLSGAR